uniref:Uncharacterized protein n=1 Tax=Arundo donax TaxID=35708 RepID=A0A0A9AMR4_ARUDO
MLLPSQTNEIMKKNLSLLWFLLAVAVNLHCGKR